MVKNENKKGVLFLIEDDPTILELYRELFKNEYILSECTEFEFCADFCNQLKPNVVVLDLCLTNKVTGYDILAKLTCPTMKVIVCTAMTDRDTRAKVMEMGANDYVTKPINNQIFKRMVRTYMNMSLTEIDT